MCAINPEVEPQAGAALACPENSKRIVVESCLKPLLLLIGAHVAVEDGAPGAQWKKEENEGDKCLAHGGSGPGRGAGLPGLACGNRIERKRRNLLCSPELPDDSVGISANAMLYADA